MAHATDPAVVGLPTVAPAISLLAQADPLQGTALPILPHAGPRHAGLSHGDPGVLGQLAAAPGMTAVGALAAAPARLWEALVLATDDAAPSPIARQDALLIGAALWLMTAAIFTVGLLLRRRSRARGKYRPGSGVRLRERPTDWPPTDHWDRRVHHIVPQTPTASARTLPAEEAPHPQRTSGSGSRRRRSGTRSLHRRFSYSTLD
ncbi:hypothetical protein [Rhodobaculum claviforme]|uniref:hypothetical protein n=1 Tax=Rhodobaculum claviforme TaxID=1549854 RepID=UPI00191477BE|nr:hypothetical protein [Rhodobaculum claviforme]